MASPPKAIEQTANKTKKSYSYQDILNMKSDNLYSSIGKMLRSEKPTAPRPTFGKSERPQAKKVLEPFRIAELQNINKEGKGPGAYLPPRYILENGQTLETKDPSDNLKYNQIPAYSIGKTERKGIQTLHYAYMNSKNDLLDLNSADLKRRNSMPCVKMGTEDRWASQRKDKVGPGPTYDPKMKPDAKNAPKYTMGARRPIKGSDPLIPTTSTTNLVGPSTYFQKNRSKSTTDLSRVPHTSKIRNEPAVSFAKGPKSLATFKSSVDETYDIKTKTIMAHYDFEYDAGKGLHSGTAWMKKNIIASGAHPLQKNKMKSYSIGKTQKEENRGFFKNAMTGNPVSVRIQHPKF